MQLISVIVTTYNWPEVLNACLISLFAQNDENFEIIVADDGSSDGTGDLIKRLSQKNIVAIKHVFHEDLGFRAGTIRNKAVMSSHGDYLIFIDGDCVVFPNFIRRHRQLAEQGYFVPGNRLLLSKDFTSLVLQQKIPLHRQSFVFFANLWFRRKINRLLPIFYNPFSCLRYFHPKRWQKAMTCNLSLFKKDFLAVNGFDEEFEGWGYEDSDLVIRLIHNGIKRKEGRFAVPVLHHWHKKNSRDKQSENYLRLMKRLNNINFIRTKQGINKYL